MGTTTRRPCKACSREIMLVQNTNGRWVPLDARPTTVYLPDSKKFVQAHITHFITCPEADELRKAAPR